MRSRVLTAALVACCLRGAFATTAPSTISRLSAVDFHEPTSFPHDVPLGRTGIVQGVAFVPKDGVAKLKELTIDLPATVDGGVCVEIHSIDGQYDADLRYQPPGASAGRYVLDFPTKYEGALGRYRAEELATVAYGSAQCPDRNWIQRVIFLTSWQTEVQRSVLTFLVDVRGADAAIATSQRSDTFACARLKSDIPIAYNARCDVSVAAGAKVITATLVRWRDENRLAAIPVRVYVP